jgi:gamma-glutamyl-gamma-aminobutyrate hydrolase PuuD
VAVQWHPENFHRTGEFSEIFQAFIDAASRRR